MRDRIKRLREQSVNAINRISHERAHLITQFYKQPKTNLLSIPMQRAKSFEYIFDNKKLCYNNGELIIGERGEAPKATPTYPEITVHSLEDLHILNDREKVSFSVSPQTYEIYENEIIPFWSHRNNRDRIFANLPDEWKNCYTAGVFTEFQEQRAPGHTVLGKRMFNTGFSELINEINGQINAIDFEIDPIALSKRNELIAMNTTLKAMIDFAHRNAEFLEELTKKNIEISDELHTIAKICRNVPENAPQTFHEALQHYWFIHLGVITEVNPWDSFNPGRLDQHLYPFYQREISEGTLTEEDAKELLQSFWIKFNNHPAPPKIGITAKESNTYTDFCLINLGGVKEDGTDAVNPLSYIILNVIQEMRLLQPSSMIQISKKNPDHFIKKALEIIKTGFGQPSIFNTDAIIQELLRQGKDIIDSRNGGASGCVETGAFGTECYTLTGYFNLAKILEITLNNGFDPRTDKQIGLKTGEPTSYNEFNDLIEAYEKQLNYFATIKIKGNNIIQQIFANYIPVPFLSTLIDGCIQQGKDYNCGGAKYNTSYIQGVGLGSLTDQFTAIEHHVFKNNNFSMEELLTAMKANFVGYEKMRDQLSNEAPKYGNDDDFADSNAVSIFEMFFQAINDRPTAIGGKFRINLLPTTSHVYFGSVIGATADGRLAKQPLSEGISPFQGNDKKGPTAVLKSAAKIDHLKTGGTLLNQKFTPDFFEDETSIRKMISLIRTYFRLDGHHIQFNVVNAQTLRNAQNHPEDYRDLIVRVAGYSDYFNDLGKDLQNEIISRTEHRNF